jgi:SAM-dependent methyltransferase
MTDNITRFTSRSPYYHVYRPHYPRALADLLAAELGMTPQAVVVDVGAGTGISSELFLSYGCTVYAVEPNAELRAIADTHYGDQPNFQSVVGTAEETGLPNTCADFVVAGQAFHWFSPAQAKLEFRRILKPSGWVVLFWNNRAAGVSPFIDAFNAVMTRFDIHKTSQRTQEMLTVGDDMSNFFGAGGMRERSFDNPVSYGWEALLGRALSASYAPLHDHPTHPAFVEALRAVFDQYQQDGLVWMPYTTQVYYGKIG